MILGQVCKQSFRERERVVALQSEQLLAEKRQMEVTLESAFDEAVAAINQRVREGRDEDEVMIRELTRECDSLEMNAGEVRAQWQRDVDSLEMHVGRVGQELNTEVDLVRTMGMREEGVARDRDMWYARHEELSEIQEETRMRHTAQGFRDQLLSGRPGVGETQQHYIGTPPPSPYPCESCLSPTTPAVMPPLSSTYTHRTPVASLLPFTHPSSTTHASRPPGIPPLPQPVSSIMGMSPASPHIGIGVTNSNSTATFGSSMFRTACDSTGTGTLEGGLDGENQRFVGGITTDGERNSLRRDREKLPKLEVKKPHDPTDTVHTVQRWLREVSMVLGTWTHDASGPELWRQIVTKAERDHALWTTLTPGQRAIQGGFTQGAFALPQTLGPLENQLRASLLEKDVLPQRVKTMAHLQQAQTPADIVILVYREYLPSEQTTRAHGLKLVEQPLRGAKTFKDGLQQIRHYMRDLRVVLTDLRGSPEPTRIFHAAQELVSGLMKVDLSFGTQVAILTRSTKVDIMCTMDSVWLFLEGLEAELSAAALKEEQSNARGRERDASGMMAAGTGGKPSGKPSGSGAGTSGNPGATGFKDVCRYYMSDNGCRDGGTCPNKHVPHVDRCLRCGSLKHRAKDCTRPRKLQNDADRTNPAAPPPKAPQGKAKAKGKPKAKPGGTGGSAESESGLGGTTSALAWALGDGLEGECL
eukprot:6492398-Amphidinium_carterae.1